MAQCPNCGAAMSCGCQKKVLPNGKVGCAKCYNTPSTVSESTDKQTNNTD